jgi:hypothetical protein
MNWTEGKLARHSRARQSKQTILRQKEHFAKARAGLLPNASNIPPSFPLFPATISLQPDISDGPPIHQTLTLGNITGRSLAGKRRRSTPSPTRQASGSCPVSSHQFDPKTNEPLEAQAVTAGALEGNAIQEKRRKLLGENDWAGIRMQKPIPVRFDQSASGEKKWSSRQRCAADRSRHLIRGRHDQQRKVSANIGPRHRKQDVRITVGSQEVRLGQGSSVRQSGHSSVALEGRPAYRGVTMPSTFLTSSSSSELA